MVLARTSYILDTFSFAEEIKILVIDQDDIPHQRSHYCPIYTFQVLREQVVTSIIACYSDKFDFVEEEINRSISYIPVTF